MAANILYLFLYYNLSCACICVSDISHRALACRKERRDLCVCKEKVVPAADRRIEESRLYNTILPPLYRLLSSESRSPDFGSLTLKSQVTVTSTHSRPLSSWIVVKNLCGPDSLMCCKGVMLRAKALPRTLL